MRDDPRAASPPDASSTLRSALVRFSLLSMLALVALGLTTAWQSDSFAERESVRDARQQTQRIAQFAVAPLVTVGARAEDPEALADMDRLLGERVREGAVVRLRVWDATGRVIWADERRLVGRRFDLPEEVTQILGGDDSVIAPDEPLIIVPDSDGDPPVVAVYAGASDPDGAPFLVEAHLSEASIGVQRDSLRLRVLVLGLGGLVLFQLLVVPLAYSLARRVDVGRQQRMEVVARSLRAWHVERRRLAQELHDGVIQDLSAATYAVPVVAGALPPGRDGDLARANADHVVAALRHALQALRSLAFDLLPPDLAGSGLLTALGRLTDRAAEAGLDVRVDLADDLELSQSASALVYRVVREGVRNVVRHAQADHVAVRVAREGPLVMTEVRDDGLGLSRADGADGAAASPDGRLGLPLLREMLHDVDGTLTVVTPHVGGTVLQARFRADVGS